MKISTVCVIIYIQYFPKPPYIKVSSITMLCVGSLLVSLMYGEFYLFFIESSSFFSFSWNCTCFQLFVFSDLLISYYLYFTLFSLSIKIKNTIFLWPWKDYFLYGVGGYKLPLRAIALVKLKYKK